MGIKHAELVKIGKRWLIRNGYNPVFAEQGSVLNMEFPDVIGWKGAFSVVFEVKVSVADFINDVKKVFREYPDMGMGNHRYYLIPEELVSGVIDIMPMGWGLKVCKKQGIANRIESKQFEKSDAYEIQYLVARIKEIQRFGKCLY